MTVFQKWVIGITIIFGILFFYFWRSDVHYNRCQKEQAGDKVIGFGRWKECEKLWWQP